MNDQFVLGIDGGGTSTTAWLAKATECSDAIGTGVSEGSNARRTVSIEAAFNNIESAAKQACEAAGREPSLVDCAVLALAGCDRDEDRLAFRSIALDRQLAKHVVVVNDGVPLLALAAETGPAIAVVSGTGSIGIVRDANGTISRSGGWGYLFGDEGSGFELGASALRAVAHADDGRGPQTELSQVVCQYYSVAAPQDLISAVYDDPLHRQTVGRLAGLVMKTAQDGDAVAKAIVENSAQEILKLIRSLAHAGSVADQPFSLALSGGVFAHCDGWFSRITDAVKSEFPTLENVSLVENPARGAVILAQQELAGL